MQNNCSIEKSLAVKMLCWETYSLVSLTDLQLIFNRDRLNFFTLEQKLKIFIGINVSVYQKTRLIHDFSYGICKCEDHFGIHKTTDRTNFK